jgi:hypothetical protein
MGLLGALMGLLYAEMESAILLDRTAQKNRIGHWGWAQNLELQRAAGESKAAVRHHAKTERA